MDKLVEAIKSAALDAVGNSNPIEIHYGTVTNAEPLEITIESVPYDKDFLILSRNVTNYKTELSFDDSGINNRVTVHNELKSGERVSLLREQGGQRYLVWDRVMD